ncbi:MAG TPA: 2-amino-4-hydroxy-6-hydroxymethyldihydropteridine diphosphokinase [Chitinophagaceae bacterium]
MNQTYLLIGGNVGKRHENLEKAAILVGSEAGKVVNRSAIYETAAWGREDQPSFLNQVLQVETSKDPHELLEALLLIEKRMGRERLEKYGPRTIDIDILLFNDLVLETGSLVIPHPQMHMRRFALAPLAEIAAGVIHPGLKKSIDELLLECPDKLTVNKL